MTTVKKLSNCSHDCIQDFHYAKCDDELQASGQSTCARPKAGLKMGVGGSCLLQIRNPTTRRIKICTQNGAFLAIKCTIFAQLECLLWG